MPQKPLESSLTLVTRPGTAFHGIFVWKIGPAKYTLDYALAFYIMFKRTILRDSMLPWPKVGRCHSDGCSGALILQQGLAVLITGWQLLFTYSGLLDMIHDWSNLSQVSQAGDAVYVFPSNFAAIIQSRSFWLRIAPLINRIKETAGWLARVSFGAALVASVALVWITIIALMTASSQDNDRNNNRYNCHCPIQPSEKPF